MKPMILTLLAVVLVLSGCGQEQVRTSTTFFALDTVIEITVYGKSEARNRQLLAQVEEQCREYEEQMSVTIPTSDVARFNASEKGVEVSDATAELVERTLEYSALFGGVFDITIGPVSALWDFGGSDGHIPSQGELEAALDRVGQEKVTVLGNQLGKTEEGVSLDLGGAAKGYIADKLGEFLQAQGADSALINLGGNVLTVGAKPGGAPWTVGLEKPFGENGEWLCRIDSADSTIVTSGVSQRFFWRDGVLYHHLLDPSTGYPVQNGLYAVTVLCGSDTEQPSWHAEVLSTACFLLGLEEGLALLEELPYAEGVFALADGRIMTTGGLEAAYQIQWEKEPVSNKDR